MMMKIHLGSNASNYKKKIIIIIIIRTKKKQTKKTRNKHANSKTDETISFNNLTISHKWSQNINRIKLKLKSLSSGGDTVAMMMMKCRSVFKT